MKFKVAVIDQDGIYLERIAKVFSEKYADKLDIFSYSNMEAYQKGEESNRFDLVLFAEGIIAPQDIPQNVHAAYFVGQNDIDKIEQFPAICKYQKHEILMKQIMDLCLERESTHYTKKNVLGNITKVLYVTSASGGTGVSTVAVAAAKHFARTGKKVLYISFEKCAMTDQFFTAADEANFSDVIYLLKSKKGNLVSRIENIVQKDNSGVYFFNPCRTVFDMNELTKTDIETLIKEICALGSYEFIIMDAPTEYDEISYFLCDYADNILLVSNGTSIGEKKLLQMQTAINIWDNEKDARFMSKTKLLYNNCNLQNKAQNVPLEFQVLGNTPKYDNLSEKQICEQIVNMQFWDNIF